MKKCIMSNLNWTYKYINDLDLCCELTKFENVGRIAKKHSQIKVFNHIQWINQLDKFSISHTL